MLAIHISHDALKYAQLVNFKGLPFIESMGKIPLKDGMLHQDTASAEVARALSDQIKEIRNSADFPDNSTHLVMDSDWFPMLVHYADGALHGDDLVKYLKWRSNEMLEGASSQYSTVHQELRRDTSKGIEYLSLSIPKSFNQWVEKVGAPSELSVQNVILEIQALGDLLAASGQLDNEGGLQVILDNQESRVRCHLYQDKEFVALFQASVNWDYKLTVDHCQGDAKLVDHVVDALEKAIRGKKNPDTVLTNLFYFNSTGDDSLFNNLSQYSPTCQPLNLVDHFNFRDPEMENIDEYAIVLGALSSEIQERFNED